MDAVIIVNKPKEYTSFDVIAVLRKIFNQKKIGHTGTLDPIATGVLPVLLGTAAKAQRFMKEFPKEYIASLKLGITTDSGDITGNILKTSNTKISKEDIKNTLPKFIGKIYQIPPMYSAIKIGGNKLCDLARKGIEVKREKRLINIYRTNLLEYDFQNQTAKIKVVCSPGTYIRTLISDIGNILSCGGVMTDLIRTKSNGFSLEESYTLDQLKVLSAEKLNEIVIPTSDLLKHYEEVLITPSQKIRFKNGGGLSLSRINLNQNDIKDSKIYQVKAENKFIGLGIINKEKGELSVLKNF